MKKKLKLIVLAFAFMAPVAPFVQLASAQTPWYVATNGTGGGTSWALATNSLQGAIDASSAGDTVWVSNGVYEAGGVTNFPTGAFLTNRVAIYKAITVRSMDNDPTNTIIKGAWNTATNGPGPAAVRCVYMTNGSTLIGFTLTNGATLRTNESAITINRYGGGVYCQSTNTVISNCVLTGNSASYMGGGALGGTLYNCTLTRNSAAGEPASYAGGANGSTLYNCILINNSATYAGGGAAWGTLYNCTLSNNSANLGDGAFAGTMFNCLLIGNSALIQGGGAYGFGGTRYNCTFSGNSAASSGGGAYGGTLYNCISWGNDRVDVLGTFNYSCGAGYTNGGSVSGNITNNPLFNTDGSGYGTNHVAGNYRLRNVSPPLNAGTNFSWMTDANDARSKDLDDLRRIDNFSRQVDMGCYELLPSGSMFVLH